METNETVSQSIQSTVRPPHPDQVSAQEQPELAESITRGHEGRDIPSRPLFWSVIALGVVVLATMLIVYILQGAIATVEKSFEDPLTPMAVDRTAPPEPRMQPAQGVDLSNGGHTPDHSNLPHQDMIEMRQHTEARLSGEGTDAVTGLHYIPIDRAIDRVLSENKLSHAAPTTAPTTK